ncbi:MAG: hypothetical protein JW838_06525 [Spirochaetes bacterium]|nr:hypothetical protein [Spirochaetota bacterium]
MKHDADFHKLWDNVDIYIDTTSSLSADDLYDVRWEKNRRKIIQFGLTGYTYWFRFSVENSPGHGREWYLDTNDTQTEILELYQVIDNTPVLLKKAGRFHPESFKKWNKPEISFVPPAGSTLYYLKAKSESYIVFDLALRSSENHLSMIARHFVFYGGYYAVILIMILYNLFLFFGLRSRTYALYVIYLSSILAHQFFVDGFGVLFFGAGYKPVYSAITLIAACLFTSSFLNNRENHPLLNRFASILVGVLLIWGLASLFIHPGRFAYFLTVSIVAPLVYAFIAINCIAALRIGNPTVKYFIIAWAGLIIFSGMYTAVILELVPANNFTLNGIAVGSVYEAVTLSLALAQQLNISRREKEEADRKSLENQIKMTESFARFVPKEFLQYLGRESIVDVNLGDQVLRHLTILFCDIRSFTNFSEKHSPQETIDFLNSYLNSVSPLIKKNRGFIDKYIGDAIMALFPHGVDDAVRTAIDMMRQLHDFNSLRRLSGQEIIDIGIGIHSGKCMLGTIGETQRMETTVISDAVNTASRLEGLNKRLATNILITRESFIKSKNMENYRYRKIGLEHVRGKDETLNIYEIIVEDAV